jgi:hypothetical protein
MKNLLRNNDPTVIAFASALLSGESIEVFEVDVNMSVLNGCLDILPRRLMVHEENYERACAILADIGVETGY